jgi:hypothetical protein
VGTIAAVSVSAVFSCVFIARTAFTVGRATYFSLFDDAMISMQYARMGLRLQRQQAAARCRRAGPVAAESKRFSAPETMGLPQGLGRNSEMADLRPARKAVPFLLTIRGTNYRRLGVA